MVKYRQKDNKIDISNDGKTPSRIVGLNVLPNDQDEAVSKWYVDTTAGISGSVGQVQYNSGGAFSGDTGFTTDGAGNLEVIGSLGVDDIVIDGNSISSTSASGLTLTTTTTDADINLNPNGEGNVVISRPVMPSGNTASRPSSPVLGEIYFDTDLNGGNGMLIIWNGSNWVNLSTGATV